MSFQQADDIICLFHSLLHRDSLREDVHAGVNSGSHGTVNIFCVERIGDQTSGSIAPQSHTDHGKVHAVRRHGLPVNGVVLTGPVLIGRDVNAKPGFICSAHIVQPITVPDKVSLRQAVVVHTVIEGDLISVIAHIAIRVHPRIRPGGRGGRVAVRVLGRARLRGTLLRTVDHGNGRSAKVPHITLDRHILQ